MTSVEGSIPSWKISHMPSGVLQLLYIQIASMCRIMLKKTSPEWFDVVGWVTGRASGP